MNLGIFIFTVALLVKVNGQNATVSDETTTIASTTPATTINTTPMTTTQVTITTTTVVTNSPDIVPPQETTETITTSTQVLVPLQDSTTPIPFALPIPAETAVPVVNPVQTITTDGTPIESDKCRLLIEIKPGDTFNALAKQHKVKVRDIIKFNPLLIPNNLLVGSIVCIPK